MATKTIKALVDGVIQNIEVEDTTSPEQMLSPEERLDVLEDKHKSDDRPDWNQTDETAINYIKNKPDIDGVVNADFVTVDLENTNVGEFNLNNADTLGGVLASEYATNDFVNQQMRRAAPRNLLDNSDFTNPVNQRGATSYSKTGYTIDRWRIWEGERSVTVNNGYINVSGELQHYTEKIKGDHVYTFAACEADGTVHCMSGIPSTTNIVEDWGELLFSTVSSSVSVKLKTGDWVWAALYEGEYTAETLPEYQPKGYAVELLACQRYFVRYGHANQNNHIGWAQAATATVANAVLALSQPMRIYNPTITVSGTLVLRNGVTDITVTSAAANSFASGPFGYMAMSAEGMTVGTTFAVRLVSGTLYVSADL